VTSRHISRCDVTFSRLYTPCYSETKDVITSKGYNLFRTRCILYAFRHPHRTCCTDLAHNSCTTDSRWAAIFNYNIAAAIMHSVQQLRHGLDDQADTVRMRAGGRNFSLLLNVHIDCGIHPPSQGLKRQGCEAEYSPHLLPWLRTSGTTPPFRPVPSRHARLQPFTTTL
jgi:hypothetical protein